MSLRNDKVTGVLAKHPFLITVLLVLVVLITTGMQIGNNIAVCCIMVSGYLLIAGYGIYLRNAKKLTDESLVVLIFAAGFVLRLGYVLYTGIDVRQNDIGVFREGEYNIFHSGYILFMRDRFTVPDFDVSQFGQFYHPPFHYFVCAVFLKVYELFLPKGTHNYESLQALSLLWSQFALLMLYKTVKLLGIKKEDHVTAALIISAFPVFTLLSGSINNDILSVFLYFAGFYFGIRWFKGGSWKDIMISALAIGFGMMTKLSVGMIAFPLGAIFVVRLIKELKNKTDKKAGFRGFLQLAAFGVTCAPLGLWYEVRNYLKFGVPLGYVLRSDNTYQDISRFTPVQRLFGFYGFPIEDYYINLGSDGEQDYNIFITMVKTALFGEENYRDDLTMSMAGYVLLLVFLVMIIAAFAGMIYMTVTIKKRGNTWEDISMLILAVTGIISVISFSLKYPHICSMNFRYSTPLILCGTIFYTGAGSIKIPGLRKELPQKLGRVLGAAFFVLAILFYTILWTYVKGDVQVVDPAW